MPKDIKLQNFKQVKFSCSTRYMFIQNKKNSVFVLVNSQLQLRTLFEFRVTLCLEFIKNLQLVTDLSGRPPS